MTPKVQTPVGQATTINTSRFVDLRGCPETAKETRQRICANVKQTCKGLLRHFSHILTIMLTK